MNTRVGDDNLQPAQSHVVSLEGISLADVEKLEPAALREALRSVLRDPTSDRVNPEHSDNLLPHNNQG
jgi:hypothetical protein